MKLTQPTLPEEIRRGRLFSFRGRQYLCSTTNKPFEGKGLSLVFGPISRSPGSAAKAEQAIYQKRKEVLR